MAQLASTSLFSDANLIAYYKLEDTSDSKGVYTLTNTGSAPFVSGKYSNGVQTSSGKYLSTVDPLSIDGGAIGISLWVKLTNEITSGTYTLAMQANNTTHTMYEIAYEYNSGTPRIALFRRKLDVASVSTTYTITLGTSSWHNIILSYDTTNIYGYVDNNAVTPAAASGNGGGTDPSGFSVGYRVSLSDNPADAIIDDCAVFNRALIADDSTTICTDAANGNFFTFF